MQDETSVQTKRRGCLKWTCGGCLGVVLFSVLGAALAWHFLTRPETGISAWEHLPPSAVAAVEAHDVRSILEHAGRDKGLVSLAAGFSEILAKRLAETIKEDPHAASSVASLPENLARMGFLVPFVVPNSAVMGWSDNGGLFLIARLPATLRWVMRIGGGEGIVRIEGGSGYYSSIDNWFIVAGERRLVAEVIDNWEKRAKPLGTGAVRKTPFVFAAGKTAPGALPAAAISPAASVPQPEPRPLALSDPFSANRIAPAKENMAWKVLLLPGENAWTIDGDAGMALSTEETGAFFEEIRPMGTFSPRPRRMESADVFAKAFVPPETLKKLLAAMNFQKNYPPGNGPKAKIGELIRAAWLDGKATGDFMFFAKKPAAPPDPALPPMPVVVLGWRLRDGVDGNASAVEFAAGVRSIVEAVGRGDSNLARAFERNLVLTPLDRDDGTGETLDISPVILNSAKPVWFFPRADEHASGWIASDPAGIGDLPAFTGTEQPEGADAFAVSADWRLSGDFRLSLLELLSDRLETLPDGVVSDKEKIRELLSAVNGIFAVYPQGSLNCRGDAETERISFSASIPFGVETP